LWQITQEDERIVWHQFSGDRGVSWSDAASISGLSAYIGAPAVSVDGSGRLHLAHARHNTSRSLEVLYWLWDAGGWTSEDSLALDADARAELGLLAAAAPLGELVVMYPATVSATVGDDTPNAWFFSHRAVDLPSATSTAEVQPTLPATSAPQPTPAPPASAEPTLAPPTPTIAVSDAPASGRAAGNRWFGVILGGGLVAALVAAAFGYHFLAARRR
jgi:hypothetical protein